MLLLLLTRCMDLTPPALLLLLQVEALREQAHENNELHTELASITRQLHDKEAQLADVLESAKRGTPLVRAACACEL